jgi:hypothetical protein
MIRMGADAADLGEGPRLHSLACHRDQSTFMADTDEATQFVCALGEGTGVGQAGKRQHLGQVG